MILTWLISGDFNLDHLVLKVVSIGLHGHVFSMLDNDRHAEPCWAGATSVCPVGDPPSFSWGASVAVNPLHDVG